MIGGGAVGNIDFAGAIGVDDVNDAVGELILGSQ
jgi:hypothetical protein